METPEKLPHLKIMIYYKEHYESCTFCEKQFNDREVQYLGISKDDCPALACERCKPNMKVIVSSFGYLNRLFKIPNNNANLWRYIDFPKYISLLKEEALFFTVARKFVDPFEGAIGFKIKEHEWNMNFLNGIDQVSVDSNRSEKLDDNKRHVLLNAFKQFSKSNRNHHFINCWHMNDQESEAMWKLYSKDNEHAIAIKTTYKKLYDSLQKNPLIDIGMVNYIDYEDTFVEIRNPFWFKRKSFSHENEVRAIYSDYDSNENHGLYAKVDIKILLDKIYVSPESSDWFLDILKDVTMKYGFDVEIKRSRMAEEPFF